MVGRLVSTPVLLALFLASCATQQPARIVTPPAPQPSPAPPAPLVFPQNTLKAPPAQPIPADAIPPQPPGGLAIMSQHDPTPAAAPRPAPAQRPAAPRVEAQAAPTPEPPAEPPPAARAPSDLQSRGDRALNRNTVAARVRDARNRIGQLDRRNLAGQAKDDRNRAASLLDLATQALNRGDLRQADDFANRAAILAKTLLDAK